MKDILDNKLFFLSSVLLATFFVIFSGWLTVEVVTSRQKINSHLEVVQLISLLEKNVTTAIDQFDDHDIDFRIEFLKRTTKLQVELKKHPGLKRLSNQLYHVRRTLKNKKFKANSYLKKDLSFMLISCQQLEKQERGFVASLSADLNLLWNFNFIIILAACLFAIILSFSGYTNYNARKKLANLRNKNLNLIKNSMDCIILCDNDDVITEFNLAAEKEFGYKANEIFGKNISVLFREDENKELISESMKTAGYYKGEVFNLNKDGETFISHLSSSLLYDDEGKKTGTMGVSRNITEQKERELVFKNLTDSAVDMIYTTNLYGNCTYVNQAAEDVLGYPKDELTGASFSIIVSPKDFDLVGKHYINQFKEKIKTSYLEFRAIKKDGTEIWVGQTVKTLFDEINSKHIKGFQGIVRDISLRKEVEQKLTTSESNFQQIARAINDVFFLYNLEEKRYLYISPNSKKIMGIEPQNFYDGSSNYNENYIFPDDVDIANDALLQVSEGQAYDIQYRINKNGKTHWINEKGFPIFDKKGKMTTFSGVCRDVTKIRKSNERIVQQNLKIGQSIHYAKKIQDSTLPSSSNFNKILKDSFVFFSPKDVVSGDFYLVDTFLFEENREVKLVLLGDCTGHGVPGSILSLLCIALLKESMSKQLILTPNLILDIVRNKIIMLFQSNKEKHIHDGMDLALIVIDDNNNKAYFSGANLDCNLIRNKELDVIKGDRQHVGYNENSRPFSMTTIDIEKDDKIYLYSDGFADQFGQKTQKKFMRKKLKNLLVQNSDESMSNQYEIIKDTFFEWKGENTHTDDVTVIGVKL